jgi:hypothetical protein
MLSVTRQYSCVYETNAQRPPKFRPPFNNNNNNNNFNSIYLRVNLTAQRPITKRAPVGKKKHTYKQNTKTRQ